MPRQAFLDYLPTSPIGPIAALVTEIGVLAIEIGVTDPERWAETFTRRGLSTARGPSPLNVAGRLQEYFAGTRKDFHLLIDWSEMRPFQRQMLETVAAIPYGETRTYAQIALQIGRPAAQRAVGRANATNPVAIVLPCHRLIGADGSLRGYGAPDGIRTKAWLLELERANASTSPQQL